MRERAIWISAALAGLLLAAALAIATSRVTQPPVGLHGEPVSAGEALAPQTTPGAARARTTTQPVRTRTTPPPPVAAPVRPPPPPTVTVDDDGSGTSGRGRNRGRGGDDDD